MLVDTLRKTYRYFRIISFQLLVAAVVLSPAWAIAETYYVATNGSDSSSGSQSQPFRTVSRGISALKAGDTLYIRAGTYNEGIVDRTSFGAATQPITISGYPGDARPVIRTPSSWPAESQAWYIAFESSRSPRHLVVRGIEIDHTLGGTSGCVRVDAPHVTFDDVIVRNCARDGFMMRSSNIIVRNSHVINCGRNQPPDEDTKGIGFYLAPDAAPPEDPSALAGQSIFENNVIDGCRGGGGVIHYNRTDNNIIRNNIVRNFGTASPWPLPPNRPGFVQYGSGFTIGGDGVWGTPGPRNNQIYNNTVHTGHGTLRPSECFNLWGTGSGNQIYNNTCYDVGIGIRASAYSWNGVTFRDNIFSKVPVEQELNAATLSGTYSNNLLDSTNGSIFMDVSANDFRLQPDSAASALGVGILSDGRPLAPTNLRLLIN